MLDFLKGIKKGDKLEFDIEKKNADYTKYFPIWTKNRDFFAGTEEVKNRAKNDLKIENNGYSKWQDRVEGTAYLPWPNGMENQEYLAYKERAIYANYVEETIQSWQGKLYSKPIQYNFSKETDDKFLDDITFDGKSADNVIKEITEEIELVNKIGVLVDFPTVTDMRGNPITLTKKLMEDKKIKARASLYKAESIVNWGDKVINNQRIPIFFVVREEINNYDGLISTCEYIYRILYLEEYDNQLIYKQAVIRPIELKSRVGNKFKSEVVDVYTPMKNGKYIDYIPFYILTDLGVEYRKYRNSLTGPLVDINMGHYRNSADWEHELFQVGLKTLILYGWDKKKYGNPRMGGAIGAPMNGKADLLEASSDSGIKDEMINKENRMAVFGSQRISQQGRYVQSADTSNNNTKSESASLQSIAINVSKVMSEVFTLCAEWSGKEYEIEVQINTDFKDDMISGDEAIKWKDWFMSNGGSFDTYFAMMQKRETYPPGWTKEDELEAILNNPIMGMGNPAIDGIMRQLAELENKVNGTNTNDDNMDDEDIEEETEDLTVE